MTAPGVYSTPDSWSFHNEEATMKKTLMNFSDLELSIAIEAICRQWEDGTLVPEEGSSPWTNEDVSRMLIRLRSARGRLSFSRIRARESIEVTE